MFKNKRVLVTGGTGLIGIPLVRKLIEEEGANVRVVSLDDPSRAHKDSEFMKLDLRDISQCMKACENQEIVFHLAGIKGSPAMCAQKPASFFYPTISFNTNMLEAARLRKATHYLYTSSIGAYSPAEIFYEDDMWNSFPSENDKFAGWAKRMGELQIEAYKKEYHWQDLYIVRPANVYGPWDNFSPDNSMVIPSLIRKVSEANEEITCWGDGSPIRDFIYADDVANGMIALMKSGKNDPINLGSGKGVSIKELAETVVKASEKSITINWDTSKPAGDKIRLMSTERSESLGIRPMTSLHEGLRETMEWFEKNKALIDKRYNVFL